MVIDKSDRMLDSGFGSYSNGRSFVNSCADRVARNLVGLVEGSLSDGLEVDIDQVIVYNAGGFGQDFVDSLKNYLLSNSYLSVNGLSFPISLADSFEEDSPRDYGVNLLDVVMGAVDSCARDVSGWIGNRVREMAEDDKKMDLDHVIVYNSGVLGRKFVGSLRRHLSSNDHISNSGLPFLVSLTDGDVVTSDSGRYGVDLMHTLPQYCG